MNVRSFFSNLRSQFFPKRTATVSPVAPVQRPHSGLVQTVISRSDTQTGVKTPISKTPVTTKPVRTANHRAIGTDISELDR